MVYETKLDGSFPAQHFVINGLAATYRLDRKGSSGQILVYVWEDIPSNVLAIDFPKREDFPAYELYETIIRNVQKQKINL